MAVRRRYRSGDTLFHQVDPGDSMHLVDKGHVAIRVANLRGDLVTVDVLGPGASFGEQSLVMTLGDRRPRWRSAMSRR